MSNGNIMKKLALLFFITFSCNQALAQEKFGEWAVYQNTALALGANNTSLQITCGDGAAKFVIRAKVPDPIGNENIGGNIVMVDWIFTASGGLTYGYEVGLERTFALEVETGVFLLDFEGDYADQLLTLLKKHDSAIGLLLGKAAINASQGDFFDAIVPLEISLRGSRDALRQASCQ
jgi:hypothetical protein